MTARFEAVGVVVDDLASAVAFYRELGLDLPDDAEGHVEAQLAGGFRFMLDAVETIKSFDPGWARPSGGQAVGLAFRCESPQDVDATYERVLGAGGSAHKEPWDAFWGMRYAQVKDPSGNVVDLFADLES